MCTAQVGVLGVLPCHVSTLAGTRPLPASGSSPFHAELAPVGCRFVGVHGEPQTWQTLQTQPGCCTPFPACAAAGLGRAPATALAWMWWFKDWHLEDAYEHLTGGLRACCAACCHAGESRVFGWFKDWHVAAAYEHLTGAHCNLRASCLRASYLLHRLPASTDSSCIAQLQACPPTQPSILRMYACPTNITRPLTRRRHPCLQAAGAGHSRGGGRCAVWRAAHTSAHHAAALRH